MRPVGPRALGNGPIQQSERSNIIDVLRGFAILGILLVNFQGPVAPHTAGLDTIARGAIHLFAEKSFYPLFAFLFGLGFAVQQALAVRDGRTWVELYLRRMAVLFVIGTIHAVFIWNGDILVNYAFFGSLLILLHRLPTRFMLGVALLLVVPPIVQDRLYEKTAPQRAADFANIKAVELDRAFAAEEATNRDNRVRRFGRTYWLDLQARLSFYRGELGRFASPAHLFDRNILALFLIGCFVGRKKWLQTGYPLTGFRRGVLVGLIVAACGHAYLNAVPAGPRELHSVALIMSNLGVTLFYIAALSVCVATGGRFAKAALVFAPVGQTALSNYLLQSLVMTWLFLPYGVNRPYPTTISFLLFNLTFFFFVQVPLSRYWIGQFRFGPVEWLWRSLVWGAPQPMRRNQPQADAGLVTA